MKKFLIFMAKLLIGVSLQVLIVFLFVSGHIITGQCLIAFFIFYFLDMLKRGNTMLENQTIAELLESLAMSSIYTGMEIVQGNEDVVISHGEEGIRNKQEILKRFKELEEYKSMYEGLTK